jgi:hypothetical protein
MHKIIDKISSVLVSIFEVSLAKNNHFIKFALIDKILSVSDSFSIPEVKLEVSFINFVRVNFSAMIMFGTLEELANVMDSIGFEHSISMKESFGIPLTNVNDACPIFSLMNKSGFSFETLLRFFMVRILGKA